MADDIAFIPEPGAPKTVNFLSDLTKITRKYGVAIDGDFQLVELKAADRQSVYSVDDDSRATLGA